MERKEATNCNVAGTRHELPDEILADIISTLSPEDLGRCNCVSKLWNYSLIIQAFMLRHSRSSNATDVNTVTTFDPQFHVPPEPIKIISFEIPNNNYTPMINMRYQPTFGPPTHQLLRGDDFLCVKGHVRNSPEFVAKFVRFSNIYHGLACFFNHQILSLSELSTVLYNIRTNDLITLPKTTNFDTLNPSKRVIKTSSSIGFDASRKKYIIFRMTSIRTTDQKYRTSYETLTLGSGLWKRINDAKVPSSLSRGVGYSYVREFCLDGVIYWIHDSEPEERSLEVTYSVGAFEPSQEEFRAFDVKNILRECSFERADSCHLASLRGCPTLFVWRSGRHEVLMCTLWDHKNADMVWSNRSISTLQTYESPRKYVVCEGRFIIKFDCETKAESGVLSKYFLFQDLENYFTCMIELNC